MARHGAHHSAQKSTIMTSLCLPNSTSKVISVRCKAVSAMDWILLCGQARFLVGPLSGPRTVKIAGERGQRLGLAETDIGGGSLDQPGEEAREEQPQDEHDDGSDHLGNVEQDLVQQVRDR